MASPALRSPAAHPDPLATRTGTLTVGLASTAVVALTALAAPPARAAGITGGIEAGRMVAMVALGVFVAVWLVVWGLIRLSRQRDPARRYWLFERGTPVGLRLLALVQYTLAFLYAAGALIQVMFPGHYENDHVAAWVIQSVLFKVAFAVLGVTSANAYLRGGHPSGFRRGLALAWLCIVNAVVHLAWHGRYPGFDPVSAGYGVLLLLAIDGRYRRHFGRDRRWLARVMRRTALVTGVGATALVLTLATTSWVLTGPLEPDRDEARAVLRAAGKAVEAHRAEHGAWPQRLDDVETDAALRYRWHRVQYDRDALELRLEVRIPLEEKGLAYRLSFGRVDADNTVSALIHRLKEPAPPA